MSDSEARRRYLDEACQGDDATLRSEVDRMLDADTGGLIQRFPEILRNSEGEADRDEGQGEVTAGPYILEVEIGRGGMGSVWRARRVDGAFAQLAAVKLIRRGMDTDDVLRRFTQERQILSLLDHPNIARLLDGGATSDGRPYLAMEFVDGKGLLEYAKDLGLARKLELFLTVCGAVQHAHNHLVIHRDLKPGNILVRSDGEVKLLDFGIARIVEPSAAASADSNTVTVLRMLTPAYASPEQIAGRPLSTATDVYSLGKVLRTLCPVEETGAGGDIEAIAAKATREEPEARYRTAQAMADDVRRHLEGRPVEARAGAWSYRLSKFVRRNAWPVAAASGLSLAIVGGLAYVSVQNRRIERERDRAENVSSFLRELFSAADPERNQGNRVSTRELLDLGAARLPTIADPQERVALLDTTAEAYFNLGLYEKASRLLREVIAIEPNNAKAHAMLAESEAYRGAAYAKEADAAGARAIELSANAPARDQARVYWRRCNQLHQMTRYGPAIEACAAADRLAVSAVAERASIAIAYGIALADGSKFADAEAAYQRALALQPPDSTKAQALSSLASLYFRQGKFAEAEVRFREAIAVKRRLYPEGHVELARSLNNHANTLVSIRRHDEAVPIYQEAHEMYRKFLGAESSDLASSLSNLAVAHSQAGRLSEAERICAEVVGMQARTIGAGKLPHISSQMKHAAVLLELGRAQAGVKLLEEAMSSIAKLTPAPATQAGYTRVLLAQGLLDTGRASRAEVLAREAKTAFQPVLKPGHWMLQQNDIVLAGALVRTGRKVEARAMLSPVVAANETRGAKGWWAELARRYYLESK